MCGIFAYVNYGVPTKQKAIVDKLLNGLRRLEYRGYDSAGIAIDNGPSLDELSPIVFKETGKIDMLADFITNKENLNSDLFFENHCGIGHTRWATHGPPAPRNSHPHTSDASNEFLVVHNGIITNHQALREMLERKGFVFESETDTEVIPKLTKYLYEKFHNRVTFRQLVMEVVRQLQGAFALIFKSTHYPGELVAAKRGSPLLLGIVEEPGKNAPHAVLTSEGFKTSNEGPVGDEAPRDNGGKRQKTLKNHVE